MLASAVLVLNLAAQAAPVEGSGSLAEAVTVDEGGRALSTGGDVAAEGASSLSSRVTALTAYLSELAGGHTRVVAESPEQLWAAWGGGACIDKARFSAVFDAPANKDLAKAVEEAVGASGAASVFEKASSEECLEKEDFMKAFSMLKANTLPVVIPSAGGGSTSLKEVMEVYPGMKSIKQLLDWTPETGGPYLGPSAEKPVLPAKPRVMSIHDMAGGYQKMADNDYLAQFQHWDLVDIFVYFSHIRVAVPPLEWTGVAHHHKKLVLGTIMFEGGDGSQDAQVLVDNQDKAVAQFAAITKHYGFDGWLVNLESGWGSGADPEDFCKKLRDALKTEVGDYAQVVIYPRNPSPEVFSKADGVYVNYNWDESSAALESMVKSAAGHAADVYLGFDAWGQSRGNTFTHDEDRESPGQKLITKAEKAGLSVAVFAPGYVLESKHKRQYSEASRKDDDEFWATMGIQTSGEAAPEPGARAPDEQLLARAQDAEEKLKAAEKSKGLALQKAARAERAAKSAKEEVGAAKAEKAEAAKAEAEAERTAKAEAERAAESAKADATAAERAEQEAKREAEEAKREASDAVAAAEEREKAAERLERQAREQTKAAAKREERAREEEARARTAKGAAEHERKQLEAARLVEAKPHDHRANSLDQELPEPAYSRRVPKPADYLPPETVQASRSRLTAVLVVFSGVMLLGAAVYSWNFLQPKRDMLRPPR